jgi:long-chain fatty acid transport protein
VELLDLGGSAAFRVNDNLAVAVGVDMYWATEVLFSAVAVQNEGNGIGWGWNASGIYEQGPLAFGLSYRSAATVDIQGSATFPGLGAASSADADLPVPSRLQAGVRYRFNDQLAAEFDFTRTGWSDFDVLTITNAFGAVESINNWDDANAYRLGISYQVDSRTRLRFGYSYDETPQPREWFSARVPDNDRHLFSVGMNRDMGDGMELDAGYMYVKFKDYSHAGGAPSGSEPNGSLLYDGDYESSVHLFGIGATQRF